MISRRVFVRVLGANLFAALRSARAPTTKVDRIGFLEAGDGVIE